MKIADKPWFRGMNFVLLLACVALNVVARNWSAVVGWGCAFVWYMTWLAATRITDPNYE